MLFNLYLETLLGSKVKLKILRVLIRYPTKKFTLRELANHINTSHTAVLKTLKDLQGMNIIRLENHGRSSLLTLNIESCLYPSLVELFSNETATLASLIKKIKKILPGAKSIALFGSISKRQEMPDSDIDILVITKDKKQARDIIAKNQEEFSKLYGNVVSAYIMTENEFKIKRKTDFGKSILEGNILIKGDPL
ncbi:nucleotidyltransferase domain-containing protein [Candidatus Woesearchaeota archaeon]|nr:nucleotidyltransferase domain-containing protein [Candidatus Woesearchaeota archaeon]